MRVLLVDDSDVVRDRLARLLREACGDAAVHEARSADEAVTRAAEIAPHVVVLDLHMPEKNGLAILARIKAATPPPVVVVLTNDPSEPNRRRATVDGADYFFDKSVEFDRVVEVCLERSRSLVASAT